MPDILLLKQYKLAVSLIILLLLCGNLSAQDIDQTDYPELDEVNSFLKSVDPAGVVFHIMEDDEDALEILLPRLIFYTEKI